MSDGLKTGLILGGVGLVGFLVWRSSQAAAAVAAGLPTVPGTGSVLAPAPGVVASATAAAAAAAPAATSSKSGITVSTSTLKTIGTYAVAGTVIVPTKLAVAGAKDVYNGIKSLF
jgi:hypothetical protein